MNAVQARRLAVLGVVLILPFYVVFFQQALGKIWMLHKGIPTRTYLCAIGPAELLVIAGTYRSFRYLTGVITTRLLGSVIIVVLVINIVTYVAFSGIATI